MQVNGRGTTSAGAALVAGFARRLGSSAKLVDGSGLSRADRASPYRVVRLLSAMYKREQETVRRATSSRSPIAGSEGTLEDRMRRGPAHRRCRAKTGTLSDVSALSGFCEDHYGQHLGVLHPDERRLHPGAQRLQDRMVQKIAAQDP